LEESAARLQAAAAYLVLDVGEPEGAAWHSWDSLRTSDFVPRWIDALAAGGEEAPWPRAVAGSFVGCQLVAPVVRAAAAMALLESRAPDVSPGNVLVHQHEAGWFDRIAVRSPTVAVLAGDPAAGDADAVVLADRRDLHRWLAERIVASLDPVLQAVRAATRLGLPALWGSVGDDVAAMVLVARDAGATLDESREAWRRADALVEEIAVLAPRLRTRPQAETVAGPTGPVLVTVRGTCCLDYRTPAGAARRACGEPAYCLACPLEDAAVRRARWERYLAETG
jgi:hypothetical protein